MPTFGAVMRGLPDGSDTVERDPLVVDRDFRNHVLDRFKWQQIALRDIEPVRQAVDEILKLLGEELGARQ